MKTPMFGSKECINAKIMKNHTVLHYGANNFKHCLTVTFFKKNTIVIWILTKNKFVSVFANKTFFWSEECINAKKMKQHTVRHYRDNHSTQWLTVTLFKKTPL